MKKKLITIAAVGLLAAPLTYAQTANVTIYGHINLDMDFVSSATDSSLGERQRVSSNVSRIGIKGTESLGGGLNAIFQIESQFGGDTGGNPGTLGTRDTFLGLQGDWGTVKVGYMLTPYNNIHSYFGNAPTYLASILRTGALWAQAGPSKTEGSFDARLGNSIRYDSPKMGGFRGAALYSTDEAPGDNGWVGSLGLFYDDAGLQVGFAYETNQGYRAKNANDQALTFAVGYDFGFIRPALVYEYLEYEVNGGKLKRDMFGGSITVPIGSGKLYGVILHADKGKGAPPGESVGALRAGGKTDATLYEISYTYHLSKRTSVYAGYIYIDNNDNANYTFSHNGNVGTERGVAQQGLILGMVHNF
ncbi:MAG: porin [Burkholderiales bacterium]|jgi:predicted porin|nr:porin [Burkholderiales bacterium]